MKHAIVPGSFDPITLGHLELIRKAADLFDQVTVAVMENAAKNLQFIEAAQYRDELIKLEQQLSDKKQ